MFRSITSTNKSLRYSIPPPRKRARKGGVRPTAKVICGKEEPRQKEKPGKRYGRTAIRDIACIWIFISFKRKQQWNVDVYNDMGVNISQDLPCRGNHAIPSTKADRDLGYGPNCRIYDKIGIPDEIPDNYPPPGPAPNKRSDILSDTECQEADSLASRVRVESCDSMENLIGCLTELFHKDSQKVRVIFRWIGYQNVHKRPYPEDTNIMSPIGYLKRIADKTLSYAALITIMCRYANIPCVMIRGLAKSADYEVGDQRIGHLRNAWNAVYVDGGWRLLFPLWALSAVVGRSAGVWTVIESKGKRVYEKQSLFEGDTIPNINEYYFFVNPEQFVYRCLPDDDRWQLLRHPFSLNQFISVPYLRPNYFKHQLQILSTFKCILKANKGLCRITFKHSNAKKKVMLSYELFFNHKESNSELPAEIQLERFVSIIHEGDKTHFHIRFPLSGIFKLNILDSDQEWVCVFKIICEETLPKCEPYPINCDIGFGPCRKTFKAGLIFESHKNGEIHVRRKEELEIRFSLTKLVSVRTFLIHNYISSNLLQQNVSHKILDDQLIIRVTISDNGEYALIINSKDLVLDEEYQNTCNYLLTTEASRRGDRSWETAREKLIRQKLNHTLKNERKDAQVVKSAVEQFQDVGLRDRGELKTAHERIGYLELSTALNDGINRRNLDLLEKALSVAQHSSHQHLFRAKLQTAQDLAEKLRKIKLFTHDILEMKPSTVSEIHRYKFPKPIVHDVMKATFFLLGEKESKINNWNFLQVEMRKTGKFSVLRRIERLKSDSIRRDVASKVQTWISPYDKETVMSISAGVGTFFVWVRSIVDEVMSRDKDSREDL